MKIEVFKTNVDTICKAEMLLALIHRGFPNHIANFDLDDCDKILRIASKQIEMEAIIQLVKAQGFEIEELTD